MHHSGNRDFKMTLRSFYDPTAAEAGCDEAGRGCLAGPVYAAAVIFPKDYHNKELNDSKKLTEKQRARMREEIIRNAVSWSIASCSNTEIDNMNILRASITAMHRALDSLAGRPELLLIDGNRFYGYRNIPHITIVKGDATFLSIAAASVLAKTERDRFMEDLDEQFPVYGWKKNKGYPTREHREAILKYGVTPWHRLTFSLHEMQTELQFL